MLGLDISGNTIYGKYMRVSENFWKRVWLSWAILVIPFLVILRNFHIGISLLAAFTAALTWNTFGEKLFAYHGEEDA